MDFVQQTLKYELNYRGFSMFNFINSTFAHVKQHETRIVISL